MSTAEGTLAGDNQTDSPLTEVPEETPQPPISNTATRLTKGDLIEQLEKSERRSERAEHRCDELQALVQQLMNREERRLEPQAAITLPVATTTKKLKMIDPEKFCGGAKELDIFLGRLQSNFRTHGEMFQNDGTKVSYALSLLGRFSKNKEKNSIQGIDPADWGNSLHVANEPCLENFDLFEQEIKKLYGDNDRVLNSLCKAFEECRQGHHEKEETVRMYAQRLKALWREAELTDPHTQYGMTWYGLHTSLKRRIKPLAQQNGRFANVEELFNKASAAEVEPRTQQKPNEPKQQESKDYKGKKRPFRQSISSGSGNRPLAQSNQKLPAAPWVTKQEVTRRIKERLCVRCGKSGHMPPNCPSYGPAKQPDQIGDTQVVKKQRSFESRFSNPQTPSSTTTQQPSKN